MHVDNTIEAMQRDKARQLVTDMFRDPLLVFEYAKRVRETFEDSASKQHLTKWMTQAGYATRHDLFQEEMEQAARTNLAAWDGMYLLQVDKVDLVVLGLGPDGTTINREVVPDAVFADGQLSWSAAGEVGWNGELTFTSIAPSPDQPLSKGGLFQRSCTGKLWKRDTAKPEAANTFGSTKLLTLPPSPENVRSEVSVAAALSLPSDSLTESTTFLDKWRGDYQVSLSYTDPNTEIEMWQGGPHYGVDGTSDNSATLTYVVPYDVDLTAIQTSGEPDEISYSDGQRHYELAFSQYLGSATAFSGKIYNCAPDAATAPAQPNAAGVAMAVAGSDQTKIDPIAVSTLVVGGITLIATVGGIVAAVYAVKYGSVLESRAKLEEAIVENNRPEMQRIADELKLIEEELSNSNSMLSTEAREVGLFGSAVAVTEWAKREIATIGAKTQSLNTSIENNKERINEVQRQREHYEKDKRDIQKKLDILASGGKSEHDPSGKGKETPHDIPLQDFDAEYLEKLKGLKEKQIEERDKVLERLGEKNGKYESRRDVLQKRLNEVHKHSK